MLLSVQDMSDPRGGRVTLYENEKDSTVRILHSLYGAVPVSGKLLKERHLDLPWNFFGLIGH